MTEGGGYSRIEGRGGKGYTAEKKGGGAKKTLFAFGTR